MPDFQTERTLANQLTLRADREACDPSIIELVNCRVFFLFSAFALDKRHNIIAFSNAVSIRVYSLKISTGVFSFEYSNLISLVISFMFFPIRAN